MCRINEESKNNKLPIKIIVSILLLVGVLISDVLLKTISCTCVDNLITTVRVFDFIIVGLSVIILLIADSKEREEAR